MKPRINGIVSCCDEHNDCGCNCGWCHKCEVQRVWEWCERLRDCIELAIRLYHWDIPKEALAILKKGLKP